MLRFILTLSCPDRIGIVAGVAGFLVEHDCNIVDSAQFCDVSERHFFMRLLLFCFGGYLRTCEWLNRVASGQFRLVEHSFVF